MAVAVRAAITPASALDAIEFIESIGIPWSPKITPVRNCGLVKDDQGFGLRQVIPMFTIAGSTAAAGRILRFATGATGREDPQR